MKMLRPAKARHQTLVYPMWTCSLVELGLLVDCEASAVAVEQDETCRVEGWRLG